MSKLNDWYDWLINHVPSTIKYNASRVFKTFKDKIMGFLIGLLAIRLNIRLKDHANQNHLIQYRLSELLTVLTEVIELMEGLKWMQTPSLATSGENSLA